MANFYRPIKNKCLIPIGGVYISINDVDPSTLFGGTWQRIPGQYLMAGDPSSVMDHKNIGSNVGESWNRKVSGTAITWNQMPYHDHICRTYSHNWNGGITIPPGRAYAVSFGGGAAQWAYSASNNIYESEIVNMVECTGSGGNQPHDHTLPTYPVPTIVLNVWYRKA